MKSKDYPLGRKPARSNSHVRGILDYKRTPFEMESLEQFGYANIKYNLTESAVTDMIMGD